MRWFNQGKLSPIMFEYPLQYNCLKQRDLTKQNRKRSLILHHWSLDRFSSWDLTQMSDGLFRLLENLAYAAKVIKVFCSNFFTVTFHNCESYVIRFYFDLNCRCSWAQGDEDTRRNILILQYLRDMLKSSRNNGERMAIPAQSLIYSDVLKMKVRQNPAYHFSFKTWVSSEKFVFCLKLVLIVWKYRY